MQGVHISHCGVHIPWPSTAGIVYTLLQLQLCTGLNPKLCIFRPHFESSGTYCHPAELASIGCRKGGGGGREVCQFKICLATRLELCTHMLFTS